MINDLKEGKHSTLPVHSPCIHLDLVRGSLNERSDLVMLKKLGAAKSQSRSWLARGGLARQFGASRYTYPQWDAGQPLPWASSLGTNMAEPTYVAPSSFTHQYEKRFEYKKDIKEFDLCNQKTRKHPIVSDKHDLVWAWSADPHKDGGVKTFFSPCYNTYDYVREPTFPQKPNPGELAAGAAVVRTDVWKTDNEPAIVSIGRFTPDNFRPYGWAENAPFPDTGTPVEHLDFRSNRLPIGHADRRPFVYFTLAASGFTFLSVVRGIAVKAVYYLWPSRAAFAAGVIEVDTRPIQPGQNFVAKWQGKPVFIKRRTDDEQQMAVRDDALVASMRDPQLDSDRTKKPEWLVIVGVCTHLGCVPFSGMGEYNGWFCPCHGSHYDLSGRIRKGPAPANMKVPKHTWLNDFMVKIG